MKEKLGKGISKISEHADKLGAAYGYLGTIQAIGEVWGQPDFIKNVIDMHVNAVTRHNFSQTVEGFITDLTTHSPILAGVGLMIGGWIGKMIPGFMPSQATVMSAAQKAGFGITVGSVAATVVAELARGSSPFGTTTQSANRPAGAGQGYGYPRSNINMGGPGYPHSWSAPDGYKAMLKTESVMP